MLFSADLAAQTYNQIDENGFITQRDEQNGRFNPNKNDTTKQAKIVPKGVHAWTVDEKFGDRIPAVPDTVPHLFPQSTLSPGKYGQFNHIGSNYRARQNRIFTDRPIRHVFEFTDVYDQTTTQPYQWLFLNTLSPYTNITYDNCGDKVNGEDHIKGLFAANVGKRFGFGFDLNYLYARGYYRSQSTSHFVSSLFASYLGDHYQMHILLSNNHQKAAEDGGIASDNYITHPENYNDFNDDEIPTLLEKNWNRNDNTHIFLTHRYNLGFYRKVKMTEEEIEARKFALENAKAKAKEEEDKQETDKIIASSRPSNSVIAGRLDDASKDSLTTDTLTADTTRITVTSKAMADSLIAVKNQQDSIEALMKREFVPVTSFIHTAETHWYHRNYTAYQSPSDYYANTYFDRYKEGYAGDSIYDQNKMFNIKNTLAIALLEGFNKYVPMGLKLFVTHDLNKYETPQLDSNNMAVLTKEDESNLSIGGQLIRTLGNTFHYRLQAETWTVGKRSGDMDISGSTDLNFPLFGDSVHLAANVRLSRLTPTYFDRTYHAKHFWWDHDLDKETRTHIEGTFSYDKTNTSLRVAIDNIQKYTYLAMTYQRDGEKYKAYDATIRQSGSGIQVFTLQLNQKFKLGPLRWENILTTQTTNDKDALPLPAFNIFSNLYLDFMFAHVLKVELGGSATYFTSYEAPEFCPQLNQFAVQENRNVRTSIGEFPFIDVYANFHLKHARFFIMMSNVSGTSFNRKIFLTPHQPINKSVLHMGVSWNFFN